MEQRNLAVVASRGESVGQDSWQEIVADLEQEIRAFVGAEVRLASSVGRNSALLACGSYAENVSPVDQGCVVVGTAPIGIATDGQTLNPKDLGRSHGVIRVEEMLSAVVPPFGFLIRDVEADQVSAGTDELGMRHIYRCRTRSASLCATSAALLGRFARTGLDVSACAVYARLGHFLGDRTMFDGVTKLSRGEVVRLRGSELTHRQRTTPLPQVVRATGHYTSSEEAITHGVETLLHIVRATSRPYPEALMELSGGLDSRLILAASRHSRERIRTVTIGEDDSGDMRVAGELARGLGLVSSFVPFSLLETWSPCEVSERVAQAARGRDFASNAVTGAIYDFVGQQVPATAQITGAAGEQARGRYYAGQRRRSDFDENRVESVVRWQLAVNQAVRPDLMTTGFNEHAAGEMRSQSWQYFAGLEGDWPAVTDELYMFGRMQRWAGPAYSHWSLDRQVIAPFFHREYVDWAARLPVGEKRSGHALLRVLERLDPVLAVHPLESGVSPRQLASRTLRGRAYRTYRDGRRLSRKVRQRLSRRRHVPSGAGRLSQQMASHWRQHPPRYLGEIDFLSDAGFERFLDGSVDLDPVSIAFLVNLDGAAQVLLRQP